MILNGQKELVFFYCRERETCVNYKSFPKAIPTQSDKTHKLQETSKEILALVESTGIKDSAQTEPGISKAFIW